MTDEQIDQLAKHPAVVEARVALQRLRFATDWVTHEELDLKCDRIIAAAVAKVLAAESSKDAREVCKAILNFEQFGGINTVARLVDGYAGLAVAQALEDHKIAAAAAVAKVREQHRAAIADLYNAAELRAAERYEKSNDDLYQQFVAEANHYAKALKAFDEAALSKQPESEV